MSGPAVEVWVQAVLRAAGLPDPQAVVVAGSLLFAERRGLVSHGLIRLPTYIDRIKHGGISCRGRVRVVDDRSALVIADAGATAGAVSARWAAGVVVERAERWGIGCVAVANANHFGAAAQYANLIADAGKLGLVCCNSDAIMCAPSGGSRVLGSNPLAISVPAPATHRPQLDMATTAVALGKVLVAATEGTSIPLDWAVDPDGRPTSDPRQAAAGALQPFGGPKGFGLAFMIDALVGIAGARASIDVDQLYGDPTRPQGLGQFFVAIDVGDQARYARHVERLVETVRSSGRDDGPAPLFPGEPELRRERASGDAVLISETLLPKLQELACEHALPLPASA